MDHCTVLQDFHKVTYISEHCLFIRFVFVEKSSDASGVGDVSHGTQQESNRQRDAKLQAECSGRLTSGEEKALTSHFMATGSMDRSKFY